MNKVLILNGTISEIPIINKAKEMGYYVVTSGNNPKLPGHSCADEYICADYSNPQEILKIVKENNISGIVSCANDFGVISSSFVADSMGWKGHDTYENSVMLHQKDKFMAYFREKKFPTPWFKIFSDKLSAEKFCSDCSYPIIVKANDLTGGKGINRADTFTEAKSALNTAFQMSRSKNILIEPFLEGLQQSIVVFLINKKIAVYSCSDIYCMRNPYLVQAETYPATDFEKVREKLFKIIVDMAEDLNLADGILSFQYIVNNGVPYVIDMMRRCFGNQTLLMADERTGFPWEEAYITASLGLSCSGIQSQKPTSEYCGHYGVMAERNGKFQAYEIPLDIKSRIFKVIENIHCGDAINDYLTEKIAHIYFRYDDFEEMKTEVLQYNDKIKVVLSDK